MTARRKQPFINMVDFQREHKKLPRGVAIWIFYFSDAPEEPWIPRVSVWDRRQFVGEQSHIVPMTFLAAKDHARAEARRRGVTYIRLDPYPI